MTLPERVELLTDLGNAKPDADVRELPPHRHARSPWIPVHLLGGRGQRLRGIAERDQVASNVAWVRRRATIWLITDA